MSAGNTVHLYAWITSDQWDALKGPQAAHKLARLAVSAQAFLAQACSHEVATWTTPCGHRNLQYCEFRQCENTAQTCLGCRTDLQPVCSQPSSSPVSAYVDKTP